MGAVKHVYLHHFSLHFSWQFSSQFTLIGWQQATLQSSILIGRRQRAAKPLAGQSDLDKVSMTVRVSMTGLRAQRFRDSTIKFHFFTENLKFSASFVLILNLTKLSLKFKIQNLNLFSFEIFVLSTT